MFSLESRYLLHAGLLAGALAALSASAAPVAAQSYIENPDVAVQNSSIHELRVYAYAQNPSDRVLLGRIGANEIRFYRVPSEIRMTDGDYHVAVQEISPEPQLGVPAEQYPLLATPELSQRVGQTVRVEVPEDMALATAVVQ
jgi:hypothetical protein